MKVGENCICGSGRKFEVCCELYIDKTIEDYKVELKKNNKINAYYIAIGMLSSYLLMVQKHTNKVIESMPEMGMKLLEIDIKALSECLDRIYGLLFEENIVDNWGKRLTSIKSLINNPAWKEKCTYYQLLYYTTCQSKGYAAEITELISENEPYEEMDLDLLLCLYQEYPINGSLTKALQMLDWIVEKSTDPLQKLKYKYSKAIRLSLSQDAQAAKQIADQVIMELNEYKYNVNEPYENHQVAMMYEFYYNFTGDASWLEKSLSVRSKMNLDIFNNEGKAQQYGCMGYTYWRLGKYEKAKEYFETSLDYNYNLFSKIYMLDCLVELREIRDLNSYLLDIPIDDLGKDIFDFLYIIGHAAICLNDVKSLKVIKNYLKSIEFSGGPYFDMCLKDLELGIEKKSGNLRMILSKIKEIQNYVIIQPNFYGIGINFNKMVQDLTSDSDEKKS